MLAMLSSFLFPICILSASVVAQSSSSVVCVAGQCLQGFSNTTIGVVLSASNAPTPILLLPGQYTSTTNPQLLHDVLTSSSASFAPSPGFENATSSKSLPLNLALQPGLAIYSEALYSGSAGFSQLPSTPLVNSSTPLSASALSLSTNVWAAVSAGSSTDRVVLWDSVPDIKQLPLGTSSTSLSLLDLQSSACSPPCAGSGVCSASGTCTCPPGFTGSSCESCAAGFFGPTCQACPAGCTSCDEGTSGTGRCLTTTVANAPSTCNCLNGQCGSNGQCTCNTGWTTAANGTACAKCSPGFFLTSTGDCSVCQLGCTQCADTTGACLACKTGFTQDANDKTKCDAAQSITSTGTVCPDGSFSSGTTCATCSPSCQTCTGATSNDCIICASGQYSFNGSCVSADNNGVCEGTNLIADNNKHECDTCGAKCTSCKIPNFSVASTVNELQCTGCLLGSVLSDGKCISSCPTGSFVSPQDNVTCTACDSSCGTCAGSSTFCLTCAGNQLASDGKCVSTCPSNTFSSSGSCLSCHSDCASCSGASFNQCSSCPPDRPVLTNGRCLPTCSKSQFFDKTSSACQTCDSSCSSCSGAGPSNCLACSSSSQVLRSGSCVAANCGSGSSTVIPGLGVCLSELVTVPQPSGTTSAPPLPSITGLNEPTSVTQTVKRPLEWWQILLMALGCAFIFLVILMCWRRRARKQRAQRTAQFAQAKNLTPKSGWRWRLVRFGEKLFGHRRSRKVQQPDEDSEEIKLIRLKNAEEARHNLEIEKLIGSYGDSRSTKAPSVYNYRARDLERNNDANRLSGPSLYSQVTGIPRHIPDTRQPVKKNQMESRFSSSTFGSSVYSSRSHRERELVPPPKPASEAEAYANAVKPSLATSPPAQGSYWLVPANTGGSSRNPFRT